MKDNKKKYILIILLALFSYILFIWRSGFEVNGELVYSLFDDAMISMRYARNLAHGYGLVWNPGEVPVEGYTNILWTLLFAFVHLFPIPEAKISLVIMFIGVLILCLNAWVIKLVAEKIT